MNKPQSYARAKGIFITGLLLLLASSAVNAQQELDVIRTWQAYSDAPNSLYRHLATAAIQQLSRRPQQYNPQQRQQWIRQTLQDAVGAFPAKTPLHAKVTGTIRKDGYTVEHIVYESQPGFYVTGSLFLPAQSGKAPAVIYCSGHSANGYRSPAYQRVMLNLVKKGFVVFAFDPVGQGERLEYYDTATRQSRHKWPSNEHSYPGAQLFMAGGTLARQMIWDGIRAVDYLLTRKEVDPQRIGITGRSGGGTQCAYIAAFDERIKAAAPENYITSFRRLFESIGPQDAEQNFLGGIARGLDMGDLLTVRAPKPCLMITTTRDMFSIQGATETAKEVTAMYAALGKKDNFGMVTDDAPHASTKKNREALYAFLQKHLAHPGNGADEEIPPLSAEELKVTPTGQVSTSLKGETIFSLHLQTAQKQQTALQAARQSPAYINAMLDSAKKLSGYRAPATAIQPVQAGRLQKNGYIIEKAFVKGEGDYVIPYLLMKPELANRKAVIYLHPLGKAKAAAQAEALLKAGFTVLAPDMVGTGETGPGAFKGDSFIDSISYNLWFATVQTGRSITGIRAGDVSLLTTLLMKNEGFKTIYGVAEKEMAPVLLHAAAFNAHISRIALIAPCSSWWSVVSSRIYQPALIQSAVAGSVGIYDLPDLAASLSPRKLLVAGATDANGNNAKDTENHTVIQAMYRHHKADNQLKITGNTGELLSWWLKD
ncbi:xylan esterase [Chitinophaga lutea]|uniref:Xylan esterase n=2 Tax=Chitinophaga lutea TaxID=2488634 RepID=A0A3N4PMA3_9BACT|nr:xylan esterase [Chitinophaga lutea]